MSDSETNVYFNASMFDLTPPVAEKGEQQPSAPSLGHECVLCHVGPVGLVRANRGIA